MSTEFLLPYRSMNVDHLLVDEIEHELLIRKVSFSGGESRDVKARRLRSKLKEQREKNDFSIYLIVSNEECLKEFRVIDEKLAKIRERLDNGKAKKTELPVVKTRLIHLYYRLMRLKKNFDTEELETVALKLLNDHFSFLAENSEVRKNVEELLRNDLSVLSLHGENEENESESDEPEEIEETESSSEEEEEDVPVVEPEPAKKKEKKTGRKKTSTPMTKGMKSKKKVNPDPQDVIKKLMEHVDKYIDAKMSSLDGRSSKKSGSSSDEEEDVKGRKDRRGKGKKNEEKDKRGKNGKGQSSKGKPQPPASRSESSSSSSTEEEDSRSCPRKRRPRAVADWKLQYDGKDEGKKLNKFITEVEFMAEAEGMSKRELFNEAIHLFTGNARTWYMEGKLNEEFSSWKELVTELKLEFQPPDLDYHHEQQAAQRRQKRSEKFLDFYNAVMDIFRCMANPPSDERKFDIIFRNLRSDYKNVLVVKGIRSLKALKYWGRKLDAANLWMYQNKAQDSMPPPKSAQVHEVSSGNFQRGGKPKEKFWKSPETAGKKDWKSKDENLKQGVQKKPGERKEDAQPGSSTSTVEKRVANWKIPDKLVCFNCRGKFHHYKACLMEPNVFCAVCGFHDFRTESCPFCAKNGRNST